MANVIELNDINFDSEVKKSTQPVLVDFFATWCGPCKKQRPIIDELSESYAGKVKMGALNVDEGSEKSKEFGISSIPALLVFKNGEVVERMVGVHTKSQLADVIEKLL